jgi:alpha-L-fucosidase
MRWKISPDFARRLAAAIVLSAASVAPAFSADAPAHYEPEYRSLEKHDAPAWFEDAKLGIFIHWGLYSVPAWAPTSGSIDSLPQKEFFRRNPYAEWYLNSMRTAGSPTQKHHAEIYGADFDYYRFAEPFNAALARWNPDAMAEIFSAVHARYVVLTTKHHDGFTLWPSRVENPHLPAAERSAKRDIVGELSDAVRRRGMRMGLYYSGGIDWSFHPVVIDGTQKGPQVTPPGAEYAAYADAQWRELIERYHPSILWNDIRYPEQSDALRIVADFYNADPEGVINDRWGRWLPHDFATREYTQDKKITPEKWESCRGIGNSFGYNQAEGPEQMLSVDALVDSFVDIVSKNGNLLLNVGPKADGTIPELQLERLRGLGRWLDVNGEAIFETRPWVEAEGEVRDDPACGVRFTYKPATGAVYAILLQTPAKRTIPLTNLVVDDGTEVHLLGHDAPLAWRRHDLAVEIDLPEKLPAAPAYALRFTPQPSRVMKR